jgi:hypothetical protein
VELHAQLWPFGPDGDFWEITIRPDGTRDIKVLYGFQTGPGEITGKFSYSAENFHSLDTVLDSTQYFELPKYIGPQAPPLHDSAMRLSIKRGTHARRVDLEAPEIADDPNAVRKFMAVVDEAVRDLPIPRPWVLTPKNKLERVQDISGLVRNTSELTEPVIRARELPVRPKTTIASVTGTVHITRDSTSVVPATGLEIRPGDLVGIETGSSFTLRDLAGATVTLPAGWYKFVAKP